MRGLTAQRLRLGPGAPLFAFAGAGGGVEDLTLLAEELPAGTPVIALVAVAGADDTVESLAGEAVAMIRSIQEHGPYHLLGYSFGGLIALECARTLVAEGESVPALGLVDATFDERSWPLRLFVPAVARRVRARLHELAALPPHQALRVGARAASALARRLAHRLARRDVDGRAPRTRGARARGGESPAPSVMQANLAALARWRPRTYAGAVTLFAASTPFLGCDLEELWRPWLAGLVVCHVPGTHLDLVQTRAGAQRLAAAVTRAWSSAPPLRVLVATTFRWSGAARLAVDLGEVGCAVEAIAPPGSALHGLRAVEHSHRLGLLAPVRSLRRAITSSHADLVVPFDDRTRHALTVLYARSDPSTAAGARVRECLTRSLGSPQHYAAAYRRATLADLAAAVGVRAPATAVVSSPADIGAWFERHPGAAVLKTDGSWGGRGVATAHDADDALRLWRHMRRRPSLPRALKRLMQERDPWPLRTWLLGPRPTISLQSHVPGRPANAAIACLGGTALGAVQAEVLASDGPTGPSTVLRIIDHPDMAYAAKSVVAGLELSGLCGLDFILDQDGAAHLIELNPRATPTAHLVAADGTDLLTALRQACGQELPPPRPAPYDDGVIALFPQELRRDPQSVYLRTAFHDVPSHAPDLVARVLADAGPRHRWARRGWARRRFPHPGWSRGGRR